MKNCLVIGGGIAGLSAAVYLSKFGFKVELIEASPKLGGRAYSFKEKKTDTIVDNGQHILMGCYKNTLSFLNEINAIDNLVFQKRLEINFVKNDSSIYSLKALPLPYPFSLAFGMLFYNAISFSERLKLIRFFIRLSFLKSEELLHLTVYEWLLKEGQNQNLIKSFWEILVVSALNTDIKKASAKLFADVLKEIFLSGSKAAAIIIPDYGLSETYCENARTYIEGSGGKIKLSEAITDIKISKNKIETVRTSKREITDFDYVISSVPEHALNNLISDQFYFNKLKLEYSCILSVHLWLRENNLNMPFYGFIDSPVHWIFNHGSHITTVISNANDYLNHSKDDIFEIVTLELSKFMNIQKRDVTHYKVIKEKRATFIPSNSIVNKRPGTGTEISNFCLAGDWIDTGLPSTIESAVKSGRIAAESIMIKNKS